jgi:peptidoglycan hydrolase-like protein with peptidoglycan-binding domain
LISRPVCRSCGRRTDASRPSSAANGRSGGGDRDRDRDNLSKDDIRWAQIELHNLGLYNGSLDGVIGPETERALLGFQKSNGLEESALASRLGENSCPSQSKNQRLYRLVRFRSLDPRSGQPIALAIPAPAARPLRYHAPPHLVSGILPAWSLPPEQ